MSNEQKFSQFPYRCTSKGLVARFANDSAPDHAYVNLKNMEVRQESALSIRFGRVPLTVNSGGTANQPLAGSVNTLGRLKGLAGAIWRYASAGGNLYRIAGNAAGPWSNIYSGLSTTRCSMVSYTPPFSSTPYEYIADNNVMLQDNGTGVPSPWGIPAPVRAAQATVQDVVNFADIPLNDADYSFSGYISHQLVFPIVTTSTGTIIPNELSSCAPASLATIHTQEFVSVTTDASIVPVLVQYIDGDTPPNIWFQSRVAATGKLQVASTAEQIITSAGSSFIQRNLPTVLYLKGSAAPCPTFRMELRVIIDDTSPMTSMTLTFSSNDTSFTSGYSYSIPVSSIPDPALTAVIDIPISSLVPFGPSPNLGIIVAFRINTTQTSSITLNYQSLRLDYGQGPTILGGIDYDYLYTYFDNNTGDESGPSPLMLAGGITPPVGLFYDPILVQWIPSADARVTHVRIYRRGGTLPTAFNLIAQVPVGSGTSFYDNVTDNVASTGSVLNIDTFLPVPSTLPSPVNTTLTQATVQTLFFPTSFYVGSLAQISAGQLLQIGSGSTQETVIVVEVNSGYFTAYSQFVHNIGEIVYGETTYAQPLNIAQIGFDRIFLAGDKNNPGRLYFSNVGYGTAFGVENFIDMDDTTDPIMGVTPVQFGKMYVFTLGGAIYQIYSVSGSVPVQVRTNATHGMFSLMAFFMMDAGVPYYSNDGIYLFNGSASTEVSQFVQWVWREYNENTQSPVPVMDLTKRGQVVFGFYYDEVFVAYPAVDGNTYRLIYSIRDNRWRNDDLPAVAMNYEKDIAALIYGDATGMVYQDRIGDVDQISPTTTAPIPFHLTTASLDQGFPKNPKVYQEVTVDINTNGQNVTVSLLFGNQSDPVVIGVVNTVGRQQVNLTVNEGEGISSVNAAFDLSGMATANIDVFELHFQALVDTETRLDFDTWWSPYGTRGWKTAKQGYFDYVATSVVTVFCFLDGNPSSAFAFDLPSTNGRREAIWVRFPAFKGQLFRWVGICSSNFQLYDASYIEVKPLCGQKGYSPQPLAMGGN